MIDLYKQVRVMRTLNDAWKVVRSSSLQSSSPDIRNEAIEFDADAYKRLKSIQAQLQRKTFKFLPQYGVAKQRAGKTPRPLVIAPIENRIVQRAILDVLQVHVPYVQEILNVPTSFGGIKGKNVEMAISALNEKFSSGATHYIRSDIPSFFTKVVRSKIIDILKCHVDNVDLLKLFSAAIETSLSNFNDLARKKLDELFPLSHEGVAQGSPLSPLIANIYLSEFDREMNKDGVSCIRYIDDFVIMADSERLVSKGFRRARAVLARHGLEAYSPETDPSKASRGCVADGFDFLGCYVKPGLVQPAQSARNSLLDKVDSEIQRAYRAAKAAKDDGTVVSAGCYGQAISNINNIVWGWGKAFRFCTGFQVLDVLDEKISQKLDAMDKKIKGYMSGENHKVRRKILGVRMVRAAMDN